LGGRIAAQRSIDTECRRRRWRSLAGWLTVNKKETSLATTGGDTFNASLHTTAVAGRWLDHRLRPVNVAPTTEARPPRLRPTAGRDKRPVAADVAIIGQRRMLTNTK